jgi:hypothetical protein
VCLGRAELLDEFEPVMALVALVFVKGHVRFLAV